jgi:outer membrane protein assembly factor BamB
MERKNTNLYTYPSLLIIALLMTACSSLTEQSENGPKALTKYSMTRSMTKNWQLDLGADTQDYSVMLHPVLFSDQIIAIDGMGHVQALDVSNGSNLWTVELNMKVSAGLGRHLNHLYLASHSGQLLALDSETGQELWRVSTGSEVLSVPQANDKLVLVQSIDGRVSAYKSQTGEFLWSFSADLPSLTLRGTSTPILTHDLSYAGFANGKLVALDNKNGAIVWEQRISLPKGRSEIDRLVDIDGPLQLDDQLLFINSYQGPLAAVDIMNGELVWQQPVSSRYAPLPLDNQVVVLGQDDHVSAYDKSSGVLLWHNDNLAQRGLSGLQVSKDAIIVTDQFGYSHILSWDTGQLLGRYHTKLGSSQISALKYGKQLYLQNQASKLIKLTLD